MFSDDTPGNLTVGIAAREAINERPAAWAIVTDAGETYTRTMPRNIEHTVHGLLLGAFEHLITDPTFTDTPLTAYCGSLAFVHTVQPFITAWDNITIRSILDADTAQQRLVAQAGNAAEHADSPAPEQRPERIIAATDGSAGGARLANVSGYGFITDHGKYEHGTTRRTTPLGAELIALCHLLTATPTDIPLIALVDSRDAIAIAETLKHTNDPTLPISPDPRRKLHALLTGRDVAFEWVRGHSGHLMNEAADRLAVLARRSAQMGTPHHVTRQIADQIATTTWAALANPTPEHQQTAA